MLSPAPQIRYVTAEDGYRFATRVWDVDQPLAHVVYLHGIVSHGGWYLSSCMHLAKEGFCVHFLERRGSGLNSRDRGDVDHWKTWLADVAGYLASLPHDRPRILLGISWGGTLAAAVAQQGAARLDGLGLICPGLFSRKAANRLQRAALRLARAAGLRGLRVTIPLQDPALFTNSEAAKSYIARDPFVLRRMTIRMALANLALTDYATSRPESIRVPTLLMLAGQDPITLNPQVGRFVERTSHDRRQIIEYPGASHTLEFEPDPSPYFHDLAAWCRNVANESHPPG